jgi:predicted site-specific integrase-resolvase
LRSRAHWRDRQRERITNVNTSPPIKRAAIYARYSTDLQKDRSIADQIAVCRSYAERHGYHVVEVFEDRAASGASIHGRPGIQKLIQAVKNKAATKKTGTAFASGSITKASI